MTLCRNCGFEDCLPTDRFCIKCGMRLSQSPSEQEAIRVTKRVYNAATVYTKLARTYLQRGKYDAARRAASKVLAIEPDHEEARMVLQAVLERGGGEEQSWH